MTLENSVPPYVIVPNEGAVKPPASLLAVMHSAYDRVDQTFSNLVMRIQYPANSVSHLDLQSKTFIFIFV